MEDLLEVVEVLVVVEVVEAQEEEDEAATIALKAGILPVIAKKIVALVAKQVN